MNVRSSMRPSAPKRLASRRPHARSSPRGLVVRAGHDVLEALEGLEARRVDEAGADEHVLVGEGQHGPADWSAMIALSTVSRFDVRFTDARPTSTHGVPPMRSRVQKEKPVELVAVAGLGDQHPLLALLRQQPDVVAGGAVGADVGHLGQLGVAQRGAVLGLDLDRHVRCVLSRSESCRTVYRGRTCLPARAVSPAVAVGPSRTRNSAQRPLRASTLNSSGRRMRCLADVEHHAGAARVLARARCLSRSTSDVGEAWRRAG